ncbi:MAG: DUF2752 domain-containing protein [Culturomica sp.]|nr:DUF2752 domain-containing protein [Culturomica sp.]
MAFTKRNIIYGCIAVLVIAIIAVVYFSYDPAQNSYFPKCPFYVLTGYKCPGCGSQRAIHALLNGNVISAFTENMLLVLAIPYILLGVVLDIKKFHGLRIQRLRKTLYGQKAILAVLIIIIGFWILRNVF